MKRHSYTITELLTVIAIIAILAAIAIPSVNYARKRARRTACISNQGQTMKLILNAMSNHKNFLYSGDTFAALTTNGTATAKAPWTQFLAEKNYIKSMEALRCPEFQYEYDEKVIDKDSIQEAYGVVYTANNNGKFDFRGTKLFMYEKSATEKVQIAPSTMVIGGCSTTNGQKVSALLDLSGSSKGNITGAHGNDTGNMFFYDGHAESVAMADFAANKYYPSQTDATSGKALAVDSGAWKDSAK